MIRPVKQQDAAAIAGIYNPYILETTITFEEQTVSAGQIRERINRYNEAGLPWLVAEEEGQVLGYAYAAPWRERSAYRFSVEVTVYLSNEAKGRGLGQSLLSVSFFRA
ncbi:GNAT family N-acetyltransferase [Endozoicomonas montiporae]|uniref:GNAT family N-acetyltransferase n=1 Tax=Endozoicomonas montiporae TaxID=1027273 RepID=UPI000AE8BD65|nr:GNAT family N-acetyltransferase [Endozoicomonas montiporae]